jgi:ABC-type Zn uptake system ZnuABC Zn-binding protein ZnuA
MLRLLLVLSFMNYSCGKNDEPVMDHREPKLRVVTTVAPITSIVENVAGDKIQLTGIIPEGMNSHTFEPIPTDIKLLAAADLIVLNGLELEIPTLRLAKANKKSRASILMLGNRTITDKDYLFDLSFPRQKGHPNPHLWLNPAHVMKYVQLIRDELVRLDLENQASYEQNAALFLKKLEALDGAITRVVMSIPPANRRLLTYHDSWPYFARRYGFEVIGAIQPSDFSDPSPKEVARLIDQIRMERVPAVFGSEVFPSPVLEQIAKEAKTSYIDKLRDDDLPGSSQDPRHSYIGMMLYNLRVMFGALGGSTEVLNKIDPTPVAGSHADYREGVAFPS